MIMDIQDKEDDFMASNDEIMDKLDIIQQRFTGVETALEEISNSKPETVEMNERDRNVLLSNIRAFEENLSRNIKNEIIQQQTDFKIYQKDFSEKLVIQNNNNKKDAEELFKRVEKVANSVGDMSYTVRSSVESGFRNLNLESDIKNIMRTEIKESLQAQTKANEQAVIKIGNTAVQMRETFKKYVSNTFAWGAMIVVIGAGLLGFKLHQTIQEWNCENVFNQFYQEKYDKEIAEPMMKAEKEAAEFLKINKQEATDYLKNQKKDADAYNKQKKQEADQYLKTKMEEADRKADEEYQLRLNAYAENAKKEVSKTVKANKSREEK